MKPPGTPPTPEPPKSGDEPAEPPKDGKTVLTDNKKDASTGAPEKYDSWKVPDGFTLDEKVSTEVNELFKGLNLPQEAGQKLVDFYVARTQAAAEAPYQLWKDQQEAWVKEIKSDPEIGGKLDQVRSTVAKAIDGIGDPKLAAAFREAMDYTGAGNHPAFIRAFYKLAQKVTEGTSVRSGNPARSADPTGRPSSIAAAMYPHLK